MDDLAIAVNQNEEGLHIVSNAVNERRQHARGKKAVRLERKPIFVAVHRSPEDDTVYYRRLERAEFQLLSALRKGKSLGAAASAALRNGSIPRERYASAVQEWFHNWSAMGWFCAPGKNGA